MDFDTGAQWRIAHRLAIAGDQPHRGSRIAVPRGRVCCVGVGRDQKGRKAQSHCADLPRSQYFHIFHLLVRSRDWN